LLESLINTLFLKSQTELQLNMKSAVTISLVPEAIQGPFVFHGDLEKHCRVAAELGFDAVEIFPPDGDLDAKKITACVEETKLKIAAMGTGAGWIRQQLTLTSPDPDVRSRAIAFIRSIVDLAGQFGAPAIVGSMQGRIDNKVSCVDALGWLGESLSELADYAAANYGTTLLFEPLNRYESNVFNRLGDAANWLMQGQSSRIRILADLFHMNIEEADLGESIRQTDHLIGHVHFADSNREAVGRGHTNVRAVIAALRNIEYQGYLSAEIFPRPDSQIAAKTSIDSFHRMMKGL
jgi:sugar phosphate isomerase/epimerase